MTQGTTQSRRFNLRPHSARMSRTHLAPVRSARIKEEADASRRPRCLSLLRARQGLVGTKASPIQAGSLIDPTKQDLYAGLCAPPPFASGFL